MEQDIADRGGVVRSQRDGAAILGNGLRDVPEMNQGVAQSPRRVGEIGLLSLHFTKHCGGFGVLAAAQQGEPQVEKRSDSAGGQLQGLSALRDGLLELAGLVERVAEIRMGIRRPGIEGDGQSQFGDGPLSIAERGEGAPQIVVEARVARIVPQGLAEPLFCLFMAAALDQHGCQQVEGPHVAGTRRDRRLD